MTMILASRSVFMSTNLMVPFVLTCDLDLSRSSPLHVTFWAIPRLLMGKAWPNFSTG